MSRSLAGRCYLEEQAAVLKQQPHLSFDGTTTTGLLLLEMNIYWMQIEIDVPTTIQVQQHVYRDIMDDPTDLVELAQMCADAVKKKEVWGDLEGFMTWVALHKHESPIQNLLRKLLLNIDEIQDPDDDTIKIIVKLNTIRFSQSGYRRSNR